MPAIPPWAGSISLVVFLFVICGDSAENNVRKQCKRLKLTTRKGSNTRSAHSCHHSQHVTVIPHDLMDRRDGPLYSCGDAIHTNVQQCTEHRTPPAHQRRVTTSFEQFWHATDFRRSQTSQEMGCLVRKLSSPRRQPAVLCLVPRARTNEPLSMAHLGSATPSRVNGHTRVVSMASCAPRNWGFIHVVEHEANRDRERRRSF